MTKLQLFTMYIYRGEQAEINGEFVTVEEIRQNGWIEVTSNRTFKTYMVAAVDLHQA